MRCSRQLSFRIELFDNTCKILALLTFLDTVKFIDFEYAGYNYDAFDIGNHFNEFAGKISKFVRSIRKPRT